MWTRAYLPSIFRWAESRRFQELGDKAATAEERAVTAEEEASKAMVEAEQVRAELEHDRIVRELSSAFDGLVRGYAEELRGSDLTIAQDPAGGLIELHAAQARYPVEQIVATTPDGIASWLIRWNAHPSDGKFRLILEHAMEGLDHPNPVTLIESVDPDDSDATSLIEATFEEFRTAGRNFEEAL